jgi:N-acetylglutamate synthase (EC 2.3.1.1)
VNNLSAQSGLDSDRAAGAETIAVLRAAAPYIHQHRGRTLVVLFGGEVVQRDDFEHLIYDLALLHSLGLRLVLVHGMRPQIEAELALRGLEPRYVGDLRVTDAATMDAVRAAAGALRLSIEARLSASLASTPMGGARLPVAGGNWITARPVGVRQGVDHQLTGEVRRIDVDALRETLDAGRIALLSPVGHSPSGESFNLRAGEVAQAVAASLGADKLLFILERDPREWRLASGAGDAGQLSLDEALHLLSHAAQRQDLPVEDRAHVRAALAAVRAGVRRVHLLGAQTPGVLLRELFTRDGCGLMLHAGSDYENTRQAVVEDIGGILQLIAPLESEGVLVPRSREQLELEVDRFTVMLRDGAIIACAALLPFPENAAGELACVAVHPDYQRHGLASRLLANIETRARALGLNRLFALTTHAPHWFIEHGFARSSVERLPMRRASLYNYQRNSLVLEKPL